MKVKRVNELSLERAEFQSKDATKYLLRLSDRNSIESVILKHEKMTCACVSSQVGCHLNCLFCATGKMGFIRNLTHKEIMGQIEFLAKKLQNIHNCDKFFERILFMGMGEPLSNYKNVIKSVLSIHNKDNKFLPEIFIATTGKYPAKILKLAIDAPFVRLWVSLCAPDDEIRAKLMPKASTTSICTLLNTVEKYANIVHKPVRVGYLMIKGYTDSLSCADKLVKLLKGRPFELQLTKLNLIKRCSLKASSKKIVKQFAEYTSNKGIITTIFDSKGSDIMAACGQLSGSLNKTITIKKSC